MIAAIISIGIAIVAKLKTCDKTITTRCSNTSSSRYGATPPRFNLANVAATVSRIRIAIVAGFVALDTSVAANHNLDTGLALGRTNKGVFDNTSCATAIAVVAIAIVAFFIGCLDSVTAAFRNSPIEDASICIVCSTVRAFTFR